MSTYEKVLPLALASAFQMAFLAVGSPCQAAVATVAVEIMQHKPATSMRTHIAVLAARNAHVLL